MTTWGMFRLWCSNRRKLRILRKVDKYHRELDYVERTCDEWLSRLLPEDHSKWLEIKRNVQITRDKVCELAREVQ